MNSHPGPDLLPVAIVIAVAIMATATICITSLITLGAPQ